METYFNIKDGNFLLINRDNAYEENELKKAFAKSLREIREYSHLSLKQLSEGIKIPVPTLSAYENETRVPSFILAMKIASFFGSNLEDFILNGLDDINGEADIFTKYDYSRGFLQ